MAGFQKSPLFSTITLIFTTPIRHKYSGFVIHSVHKIITTTYINRIQ